MSIFERFGKLPSRKITDWGISYDPITQADIESMTSGVLTENTVRYMISKNYKPDRWAPMEIVDPSWFINWITQGFPAHTSLESIPKFLRPNWNGGVLKGLVIPYQDGINWSVFYIDFIHCGAIHFSSIPEITLEPRYREYMQQFYINYGQFFTDSGSRKFEYLEVWKCMRAGASAAMPGIYTVAAVIDLMASARPREEPLEYAEVEQFREHGVKWLTEEAKRTGILLFASALSQPEPKNEPVLEQKSYRSRY